MNSITTDPSIVITKMQDGTLCDTDPLHHEVFSDLLLKHGKNNNKPIDNDFFHEHIAGKTNEAIFPALFPELDGKTHITMWEEKERAFRELAESKLKRLPGLTELLQWAKTMEITVVAVTNAPRPNADLMLKALQLENGFAHLVIGTECVRAKPHPEPYLEGLRLAGEVRNKSLDPKKCIAFEDSPTGMTAAVGAGIPTVGVMTSQSGLVLEEAGASVCISDFEDPQLMDAMA